MQNLVGKNQYIRTRVYISNTCKHVRQCLLQTLSMPAIAVGLLAAIASVGNITLASTNACYKIYSSTGVSAHTPAPVTDLASLGQAMSQGMLLNDNQADIFEVYRQIYFGDPKVSVGGYSLTSVSKIVAQHPELEKPHFQEFNISAVERIYETPKPVAHFISSQITTGGQIRNQLFQIDANLGYWKKLLDYQDPPMPESLVQMQKRMSKDSSAEDKATYRKAKKEYEDSISLKYDNTNVNAPRPLFIKYLNRIINKANRDLLAQLKNKDTAYYTKAKALFATLKYLQEWMDKNGRNTQVIRQAMVDLAFTIGLGNQSTLDLLKSPNGMDKIQGLNQLWSEADNVAEELGYAGHFAELLQKLKIDHPTGLSRNLQLTDVIKSLEKQVLASSYTTKPTDTVRVRSLSLQESPFRSCLGSDCSTRSYFDKALDPNYIYFTMTDSDHHSDGHATLVLGTATDPNTHIQVAVAFLDKLQNIPTQKIEVFLNAVAQSLATNGYKLAIPTNLGKDIPGHGGLSNMSVITDFVQLNIMRRLNQTLSAFTPHQHQYNFKNSYSRGDQKLEVKIFNPADLDQDTIITAGKSYSSYKAESGLDKNQLIQDFLKLKDSAKEEDQIRFVKSAQLVESMEKLGLYLRSQYIADIKQMLENKSIPIAVRKSAFFELLLQDVDKYFLIDKVFSETEIQQINAELKQWKQSTVHRKIIAFHNLNRKLILAASNERKDIVELLLKVPGIDINAKDILDRTALSWAAMKGYKDIVELLLKIPGVDINSKIMTRITALSLAAANGHKEIVELLLKVPGIDLNAKDPSGRTALIHAASTQHKEIVELLVKARGIDINVKDSNGQTILIWASVWGHNDIVDLLLKVPGIDINAKDSGARTALIQAASNGHNKTVELLVKAPGIDVNAKDSEGKTALWWATQLEQNRITQLLRAHGAKE